MEAYEHAGLRWRAWLGSKYATLGQRIASGRTPIVMIVLGILITVLAVVALLTATTIESEPDRMWVSPTSREAVEADTYAAAFDDFYRIATVVAVSRDTNVDLSCCETHDEWLADSTNPCCGGAGEAPTVLTAEAVEELHFLDVRAKSVRGSKTGTQLQDVCAHVYPGSACIESSPLVFWGPEANALRLHRIRTNVNGSVPNVTSAVSQGGIRDAIGQPITPGSLKNVLGSRANLSVTTTPTTFLVNSAEAFMIVYLVNSSSVLREQALDWEAAFVRAMRDFAASSEHLRIFYSAERSVSDELEEQVAADAIFVVLAYFIMICYTCTALARRDWIRSRALLGLGGVIVVMMAVVCGLGFSGIAVPFSSISLQVLPFLMLGVGVNDVFVIVRGCWRVDKLGIMPLPEAFAEGMRHVGPSVTLTSVANIVAFLSTLGTSTPAVRWFALQAAASVSAALFLLLTVFSGLVVLNGQRARAKRRDCFPCLPPFQEKGLEASADLEPSQVDEDEDEAPSGIISHFFLEYYMPCLLGWVGILTVSAISIGIFIAAVTGLGRLEKGLGIGEVVPADSHVADLFAVRSLFFSKSGPPVYIVTGDQNDIDYTALATQQDFVKLVDALKKSTWLSQPIVSWYSAFQSWSIIRGRATSMCCGTDPACIPFIQVRCSLDELFIPPPIYMDWLQEFLMDNTSGIYSTYDILLSEDKTSVRAARILTTSIGLSTTQDYVGSIVDVRRIVSDSSIATAFSYSVFYQFFAPFLLLETEVYVGVLASLAVVTVVTFFFLADVAVTVVTALVIGLIVFDVAGTMHFFGVQLNPLSVVNLILCTGLAVEFTAHIAEMFVLSPRELSPRMKVTHAMIEVGASVANGGITTLLGVSMLAFASYSVFQIYYFRMYFLIVVVGLFHAFCVLPLVLWAIAVAYSRLRSGSTDQELSMQTDATRHKSTNPDITQTDITSDESTNRTQTDITSNDSNSSG